MTHERLVSLGADWVRQNGRRRGEAAEVLPATPLIERGLLDSLGLVNLIAFLEETAGRQIDLLELTEQEMTTLDGLCRAAMGADD